MLGGRSLIASATNRFRFSKVYSRFPILILDSSALSNELVNKMYMYEDEKNVSFLQSLQIHSSIVIQEILDYHHIQYLVALYKNIVMKRKKEKNFFARNFHWILSKIILVSISTFKFN